MSDTRSEDPEAPARNIVICCDGTGNQVTGDLSNVLKLFRIARKDAGQRVFYDPGVGTVGTDSDWQRLRTKARAFFGLVTGAGLDDNVLEAYRFLCETYKRGDRIFLFGFSRGAYTARELAALVHMVGLLRPDQLNLCDYALTAYKEAGWRSEDEYDRASARGEERPAALPAGGTNAQGERSEKPVAPSGQAKDRFAAAWQFGKAMGTRHAPIHFMGCWDTVASMIVPGRKLLSMPHLRTLPYTRVNPSVRAFRHAMAIDERRRMFRLNWWKEGQSFVKNPFSDPPVTELQDAVQLWFPGVHSDVGGGYAEEESSLSKWPLIWMIDEAVKHGLKINEETFRRLARGDATGPEPAKYRPPNPLGPKHHSLHGWWWLLEYFPKSTRWREWRKGALGLYFPRGEPRVIVPEAKLHDSAVARRESQSGPGLGEPTYPGCDYPPYAPENLTDRRDYQKTEPAYAPIARKIVAALLLLALAAAIAWVTLCW